MRLCMGNRIVIRMDNCMGNHMCIYRHFMNIQYPFKASLFGKFDMNMDLKALRKSLRQQRRAVSKFQQRKSEHDVLKQLSQEPRFKTAQKVGVYLHAFGEIQTRLIIEKCFSLGKRVFLPMICNMNQRLVWVQISQRQYHKARFSHHPLGMQEPMASRGLHVSTLDVLLLPLLACDQHGTRMGMGGGFYDRTLASAPHTPYRIGLAHNFQYLSNELIRQPWDQPIHLLITPSARYWF